MEPRWSGLRSTRAMPSAVPGAAAMPLSPSPSSALPVQRSIASEVIPHSMMVKGSVITSGGLFSAGSGDSLPSALTRTRRRATSAGQMALPTLGVPMAQDAP